jgi:hypothetical protein
MKKGYSEMSMKVSKPSRADIERAVDIVAESRRSHELWLSWYEDQPDEEVKYADTCGDREWQRRCIARYDHVLWVLRSVRDSTIESG